ncbi:MAG TPA: LysR substrate-binding domain-containing protein [Paracoccaceae bacterium]|nr:LysR substrate-binding domain-containing protein [Paracoccaceae bacterium]
MSRRHYNLPSLTALVAFEAASRHLSFKQAARELSVTPGAISHQIRALEEELGSALFHRQHRAVELTEDGEALAQALATSFSTIAQQLSMIRERRSGNFVTVGSTSAVAALWLSPWLIRFWREYPDMNMNQIVQDRLLRNASEVDLFIRYGREQEPGFDQIELYRDELVPVASPTLAEQLAGCDLPTLARQRLIHLESEDRTWTSWEDWFRQLGFEGPVTRGLRVNNYSVALQVAQDGASIALGWRRLIRPLIEEGHLAPLDQFHLDAPLAFYLVSRPAAELSEDARMVRDWIIAETRASTV